MFIDDLSPEPFLLVEDIRWVLVLGMWQHNLLDDCRDTINNGADGGYELLRHRQIVFNEDLIVIRKDEKELEDEVSAAHD